MCPMSKEDEGPLLWSLNTNVSATEGERKQKTFYWHQGKNAPHAGLNLGMLLEPLPCNDRHLQCWAQWVLRRQSDRTSPAASWECMKLSLGHSGFGPWTLRLNGSGKWYRNMGNLNQHLGHFTRVLIYRWGSLADNFIYQGRDWEKWLFLSNSPKQAAPGGMSMASGSGLPSCGCTAAECFPVHIGKGETGRASPQARSDKTSWSWGQEQARGCNNVPEPGMPWEIMPPLQDIDTWCVDAESSAGSVMPAWGAQPPNYRWEMGMGMESGWISL